MAASRPRSGRSVAAAVWLAGWVTKEIVCLGRAIGVAFSGFPRSWLVGRGRPVCGCGGVAGWVPRKSCLGHALAWFCSSFSGSWLRRSPWPLGGWMFVGSLCRLISFVPVLRGPSAALLTSRLAVPSAARCFGLLGRRATLAHEMCWTCDCREAPRPCAADSRRLCPFSCVGICLRP